MHRQVKRATQLRRERKTKAFIEWCEELDLPQSTAPVGETETAASVRILQDMLKRIDLTVRADQQKGQTVWIEWLREDLERRLMFAKCDLRVEQGQF